MLKGIYQQVPLSFFTHKQSILFTSVHHCNQRVSSIGALFLLSDILSDTLLVFWISNGKDELHINVLTVRKGDVHNLCLSQKIWGIIRC